MKRKRVMRITLQRWEESHERTLFKGEEKEARKEMAAFLKHYGSRTRFAIYPCGGSAWEVSAGQLRLEEVRSYYGT